MDWFDLLLMAVALLVLTFVFTRRPMNFPPGPISLPVVGSLPAILLVWAPALHEALCRLAYRHGEVMGLYLGNKIVVVASGYEAVKHVLAREDLTARPDVVPPFAYFLNKRLGITSTDGSLWKEQQSFTLRHLHDLGFGRQTMDALILEKTRVLLGAVEAEVSAAPDQLKKGVDLLHIFPVLAVNILWTIMAGENFELTDKRFLRLTRALVASSRNDDMTSVVNLHSFKSLLRNVPLLNAKFKRQIAAVKEIQNFVERTVDERMATIDKNNLRGFIDIYIQEIKSQQDADNTTFTKDQLTAVCMDLFSAGTETTASTLGYCLRYMVQRPDVQDKLRAEVLRVVGSERLPSMNDMPKLHYTQAVLHEVLRHSGMFPLTSLHAAVDDTKIFHHSVPAGCYVMANLWSVHMDSEVWGDPKVFRPERFIAEDGTFIEDKHLMLFGHGPRMCLGETLARCSTFVFLSALMQRFQFHVPLQGPPPSNKQVPGFTTSPAPFRVGVTRNSNES